MHRNMRCHETPLTTGSIHHHKRHRDEGKLTPPNLPQQDGTGYDSTQHYEMNAYTMACVNPLDQSGCHDELQNKQNKFQRSARVPRNIVCYEERLQAYTQQPCLHRDTCGTDICTNKSHQQGLVSLDNQPEPCQLKPLKRNRGVYPIQIQPKESLALNYKHILPNPDYCGYFELCDHVKSKPEFPQRDESKVSNFGKSQNTSLEEEAEAAEALQRLCGS